MIKMIALVKKRSGLSHAEFERYWLAEHTKLSAVIGMRRYTINVRIPDPPTPTKRPAPQTTLNSGSEPT